MKRNINLKINDDGKFALATWNISGNVQNLAYIEVLVDDLARKKVDVACLQEIYKDEEVVSSFEEVVLWQRTEKS